MPTIDQTPQATDFVKYFTTSFLKDLGAMAQLRDELEKRQGSMSVIEAAQRDRDQAAVELAKAKTDAAAVLEDAKQRKAKVDELEAKVKAREDALATQTAAFNEASAAKNLALVKREKTVDALAQEQERRQGDLDSKDTQLFADDAALQARIKAFQDKVAAINI